MRRSVGTVVVAVALLGAGAASAQAATVYEGHFRGQPGSTVSLTFVKHNGKRFLDTYELHYTTNCESGPTSQATGGVPGSPTRVRDGHFKTTSGDPDSDEFFRLAGNLKRGGKAVGSFRYKVTVAMPYGACDTGNLDWVAFK